MTLMITLGTLAACFAFFPALDAIIVYVKERKCTSSQTQ